MNLARVAAILRKDVGTGVRSPVLLYALVMPVVMTLLVQVVFGSLFERQPRLGIVDHGGSQLVAAFGAIDGLDLHRIDDEAELVRRVAAHDLDAGLVLPIGFDEAVRAGERPRLAFYASGESLASDRAVLTTTTLDLLREVEGRTTQVTVELVTTGATDGLTTSQRLVPLLVLLALVIAGVFATSFTLVEERERGTLDALLVTPTTLLDVLVAKGALGMVLAVSMAAVTLALNGVLDLRQGPLLLALFVGALMSVLIGLVYGVVAKDAKSLYTLFKSLNLLLLGPVVFYLFPAWPQWIAQLFPTYWILDPIFAITMQGADLADVAPTLAVALALCLALFALVVVLARATEARPSGRPAAAGARS